MIVRDTVSTYIRIRDFAFSILLLIIGKPHTLIHFFQKPLNHRFSLKKRNESSLSSKVSFHWQNNRVVTLHYTVSLMFTMCSCIHSVNNSFSNSDLFIQHMFFMRFPWCDYDKEALRAYDREE